MKARALIEKAERLSDRSARAAYAAAVAAFDGDSSSASAWQRRADRLETMARDCRRAAI